MSVRCVCLTIGGTAYRSKSFDARLLSHTTGACELNGSPTFQFGVSPDVETDTDRRSQSRQIVGAPGGGQVIGAQRSSPGTQSMIPIPPPRRVTRNANEFVHVESSKVQVPPVNV